MSHSVTPDETSAVHAAIVRKERRLAYENPWMKVWEDEVVFPDGSQGIYGCVDKPDFALIVPFDGERFYLVEQYRYPVSARLWEFPQGSLETKPGTAMEDVARHELRQESGLNAESVIAVGNLYEAYGFSNQAFTVFVATQLTQGDTDRELTEQDMDCKKFSLDELWELVDTGRLRDAPTLAALSLFLRKYPPGEAAHVGE